MNDGADDEGSDEQDGSSSGNDAHSFHIQQQNVILYMIAADGGIGSQSLGSGFRFGSRAFLDGDRLCVKIEGSGMFRKKNGCASYGLTLIGIGDDGCLSGLQVIVAERGIQLVHGKIRRQNQVGAFVNGEDRPGIPENIVIRCEKAVSPHLIGGVVFGNIDDFKIAEAVVEQVDGIGKLHGGFIPHDDTDQLHSVLFRTGNQVLAGDVRIARLASHQIFVSVFPSGQEIVLAVWNQLLGKGGAGGNYIASGAGHFAEQLVRKILLRDQRHIMDGGIVFVVMLSVGGHKMGIGTAELFGGFVHQIHEGLHAAADVLADGVAALVGGAHHQSVEGLLHGDGFPDLDADVGIIPPDNAVDRIGGIFHHFVQTALLTGDVGGQNLGGAGGIQLFVDVLGIEDRAGVGFDQDRGSGADGGALGPAVDFVALHRHELIFFRFLAVIGGAGRQGRAAQESGAEADCYKKRKDSSFPE